MNALNCYPTSRGFAFIKLTWEGDTSKSISNSREKAGRHVSLLWARHGLTCALIIDQSVLLIVVWSNNKVINLIGCYLSDDRWPVSVHCGRPLEERFWSVNWISRSRHVMTHTKTRSLVWPKGLRTTVRRPSPVVEAMRRLQPPLKIDLHFKTIVEI